jgi:hypothetical protein
VINLPESSFVYRLLVDRQLLEEVQQRIQLCRPDLSASAIKDGLYSRPHADHSALMAWADRSLGCANRGEPLPWEPVAVEQPNSRRRIVRLTDCQAEQFDSALGSVDGGVSSSNPPPQYIRTEPPASLVAPLVLTLDPLAVKALNDCRQWHHAWKVAAEGDDQVAEDAARKEFMHAQALLSWAMDAVVRRMLGEQRQCDDWVGMDE